MSAKKQKKWHKPRHTFWYQFSRLFFGIYAKTRLHYSGEKFNNRGKPCVFVYNHQTPYDQHLLYLSLPKMPYTIASEDLFTMGIASKIIRYAQAPIPIKKSMSDAGAVMNSIRVVREGHSIALSPEGARTYTGVTNPISPAIVKFIKMLKLPVAFFILHGGYDALPRYADKPRKAGKVTGKITRVIEYDEYKSMTNEQFYEIFCQEMYVDESDDGVPVKSKKRAEYLERALYRCPVCGAIGTLESHKNKVTCTACGAVAEMDVYRRFQAEFPVHTVKEWIESQEAWVRTLPVDKRADEPVYCENVRLRKLDPKKGNKQVLEQNAQARLYADRLEVGSHVWNFADASAFTVCGRFRLNFYAGGDTFQLTAGKTFCGLKYVNLFYNYKNKTENNENGFLGI